jgi:site-specific recombinase XerC
MRDLNHQLKLLCQRNRDGSFATQRDRERVLTLIADQLHQLGFRGMAAGSLKPKHVDALVQHWQRADLSDGTIKNRLATLRWWAEKVDRANVIARSNAHYGVKDRVVITSVSRAKALDSAQLDRVDDAHVRMSLELQQTFGLRREEAIKFSPSFADGGDRITLKDSWTKGGKARVIPVRTDAQRAVLDRVHRLVGRSSLIPDQRNYRQQLRIYERHTNAAGLSKLHGLRHAYAQARFEELTGFKAPIAGGPVSSSLTAPQRIVDRQARLVISQELGHEREQITTVYLGR